MFVYFVISDHFPLSREKSVGERGIGGCEVGTAGDSIRLEMIVLFSLQ